MSEKMTVPVELIEKAIEDTLLLPLAPVAPGDIAAKLDGGRDDLARIERMLAGDERFFDDGKGKFFSRAAFFNGREFLIAPNGFEIAQGILIPGHRFMGYVNGELFPSDVRLRFDGGDIAVRHAEIPGGEAQRVMRFWSGEDYDILMAEDSGNSKGFESQLKLSVYDLAKFYRGCRFSDGDAVIARVIDWQNGVLELDYLSGEERKSSELRTATEQLDKLLLEVVDRFGEYLPIPEQMAYCWFYDGIQKVDAGRKIALDEYIVRSDALEIVNEGDYAILVRRGDDYVSGGELPAGATLSRGETSEFGVMLREVGSPLSITELEGYILDSCFAREDNFEDLFARAFGRGKLNYADEAQQMSFLNFVDEKFEVAFENYNRGDDLLKGPLRGALMELCDERLSFFDWAAGQDGDNIPPREIFEKLAAETVRQNRIIAQLNDPRFTPDEDTAQAIEDEIETTSEAQSAILAPYQDE